MACDLCEMGNLIPLSRYGERFKLEQRLMSQALSPTAIGKWQPLVMKETYLLLKHILDFPKEYVPHLRRMAGSLIFTTIYGYHVATDHDPYVEAAEEFMQISSYAITAGWLVDFMPFLRWLPWTTFHKIAAEWRVKIGEWVEGPHAMFKALPDSNVKRISFCGTLLLNEDGQITNPDIEDRVKWIATSVYGAGSDTTVATLSQFILAMVHYPHVLRKAQREIDDVVGPDRLPTFDDRQMPLTPPHLLMQADEYRGYRLPKGSFCIANMWAILHDESLYPDPHKFYPERFEEEMDPDLTKLVDPDNYAFGFGRRRCPGVHFANQSLWFAIASIIACFDIAPAVNEDGLAILPELLFAPGAFRHPKPFECSIKPRREAVRTLIQRTAAV
ncbi:O-methylsterigmatocystin oxidoreductase [Grifola frondosa]|uniref:O-methylsterigmatocystin oxidoreductase n=1 Tax=Grifola frondosa TaxID=5627 RepID=A0A1C7MAC8_GRIFR|nr:O-methylsterigmatocystin oxidoreductase [Grifola frondosa]